MRQKTATIVVAYIVYIVLAVSGAATSNVAINVAGTVFYFVVAVALYRLFAQVDRRVAIAVLPLAAIGCVIQSLGYLEADPGLIRIALLFFGLFLATLGSLIARSGFAPRLLGALVIVAGASALLVLPGVPQTIAFAAAAFGGVGELGILGWSVVRTIRG